MITKVKYIICAICVICGSLSCSDMLDTDSSRQAFEPSLDAKTDSIFYAYGIMQAMQQLADQYVFTGEMRGDLVSTTYYTDNNLRQLANFSATTTNKYDSAYVYYRVINNCNYYIAHRDTTLVTGATNVVMHEYAAVKAFRAWAYLQLVRLYGKVPFFTEPLTQISQIDNGNYEEVDMNGLVSRLAPDLEQYTGYNVPDYGNFSAGSTNIGSTKTVITGRLFIPVDVILGDLYLENGNYSQAATHYITYLTRVATETETDYAAPFSFGRRAGAGGGGYGMTNQMPDDYASNSLGGYYDWSSIFSNVSLPEVITYIPMAVNRLKGTTTSVPLAFGYNYYATPTNAAEEGVRVREIQIAPSPAYLTLSDSTDYYYYGKNGSVTDALTASNAYVNSTRIGDMRASSFMEQGVGEDSTKTWISKYNQGNIILYRQSTIWLRLAEAFNRLGMTDAAFAILKEGLNDLTITDAAYINESTRQALQTTYPLLSSAYISKFSTADNYFGIHTHGAGITRDYFSGTGARYVAGLSLYQPDTIIGLKMREIERTYQVQVGTTRQDSINAMEDLICDEYALELAFEGCRWYDLMRLARHKNEAALYGSNFGGQWLARKLAYKQPVVNLEDKNNWYLPFK